MPRKRQQREQIDLATAAFTAGYAAVQAHPLFAPLALHANVVRQSQNACPSEGWAVVTSNGVIHAHPTRRLEPEEWTYVLVHCLLHLGFGHLVAHPQPRVWNAACDLFVDRFLAPLKLGRPPAGFLLPYALSGSEQALAEQLAQQPLPQGYVGDMVVEPIRRSAWTKPADWPQLLGRGLAAAVTSAVEVAGGAATQLGASSRLTPAQEARRWFINSYPLLGALAAAFTLVEDARVCIQLGVGVAAVDMQRREVYLNPAAGLGVEEARFVIAHELLHVGLRHDVRCQGRDHFLWNVACFPAGTWTGTGQPIEQIATMARAYEGSLISIDAQGGSVECTLEHPFYVRRRKGRGYPVKLDEPMWVEAKDLRLGDYLLVPYIQHKRFDDTIDLSPYIQEGADSFGRRTFANRAIKSIPLDTDTAWLIGLYVAEGSASPRVRFSIGAHEEAIANRIIEIASRMGYAGSIYANGSSLNVNLGAVVLGRWLKEHCGTDAHTKSIPRVILEHGDCAIRRAFLDGLLTGDGYLHRQTSSQTMAAFIGSVSERLIADVALLLAQDGIGGARSVMRRPPRQIGTTWTDKELILHTFRWNPNGVAATVRTMNGRTIESYSHRWRADDNGVWYRIRTLTERPFTGTVYNMTTPDHTYIANAFLVHNCDYVINGWLVELGVGVMPAVGGLYDPTLKGESAEAIYDRMVTDMRRFRRLATLRGIGLGDMLAGPPGWWAAGEGADLDAFYRQCLAQGLEYHNASGRGTLPGDMVQEIRALAQPPISWDVELARWFERYFAPLEQRRSYAHPSRRQSATPDIARPRYVPRDEAVDARTFGVVLDTSGSMNAELLGKALGAIASYSIAHDVPAVRVVFCDAAAYDAGYMPAEAIAGRVQVRGRGGTILQPGIDLLEQARDFPSDGPLLVITDGRCDRLLIRRPHAFLLPQGRHLPFVPRGPVFFLA